MTNDLRTSIVAAIAEALAERLEHKAQNTPWKEVATIAVDAAWPLIVAAEPEEKGLVRDRRYPCGQVDISNLGTCPLHTDDEKCPPLYVKPQEAE